MPRNKLNLGGTTLFKKIVSLITSCMVLSSMAWGTGESLVSSSSSFAPLNYYMRYITTLGTSSLRSPIIAHSEFDASQGSGQVVSNVNVFNGQPVYQIPLMGINARNALSWNLSLTYNGSAVRPTLQSSNTRANSGAFGMGWSMSTPYVAVNHMGTVSMVDDVIYCDLGPYGGGQIVQNSDGKFFLSTNPYIRIKSVLDPVALQNGKIRIDSWQFFMPDGNKMFFGESENSRRTQRSHGNLIVAHPATAADGEDFVYRYDLSRYTTFDESTEILFGYSQVREPVSATASYVRESALSAVYWKSSGETIDSIALVYDNMGPLDFIPYASIESRDYQRLYESRFLSSMHQFSHGEEIGTKSFLYGFFGSDVDEYSHLKVPVWIKDSIAGGELRTWHFGYDVNAKMLNYVALPDHSTEHFLYEKMGFDANPDVHSPTVPDVMRDASGTAIDLSAGDFDQFRNLAVCMEEFCFAQLSTAKNDNDNNLYVQVYRNGGNYFSAPMNYEILGRKNPVAWYSSNYFIIADVGGRLIRFLEWNGHAFVERNDDIGGFFSDSVQLKGTIENVYPQSNYVLIQEENEGSRYIHVLAKNPVTGGWLLLNSGKECGFANINDYGESIRNTSSNHCLEWNRPIYVQTSPNLFVVDAIDVNVLNIFSFDGLKFSNISSVPGVFPDLNLQKNSGQSNVYAMNFQHDIENITLSGNTLVLAFKDNRTESVSIRYYDGVSFIPMAFNSWEYANDNGQMYFIANEKYILGISPSLSNVILWRKVVESWNMRFEMVDANVFPYNAEYGEVAVSTTENAFFIEMKDKNSSKRWTISDGSMYYHRLLVLPSDFLPPEEHTYELEPFAANLKFSPSDPIVYYETHMDVNGGPCSDEANCNKTSYSRPRNFRGVNLFAGNGAVEPSLSQASHFGNAYQITYPNRLMLTSVKDEVSGRNFIGKAQYAGSNYIYPDSIYVVKKQWKHAGLDPTQAFTITEFIYDSLNSSVEYNTHTQQLQIVNPIVKVVSTNGSVASYARYDFVVDAQDSPLYGYQRNLQGTVNRVRNYDADGNECSSSQFVYSLDSGKTMNWPDGLIVNVLDKTISVTTDYYGNKTSSITENVLFDSLSGQFRGSVTRQGDKFLFTQQVMQTQSIDWQGDVVKFRNPFVQYQYVPFDFDPVPKILRSSPNDVIFPDSVANVSKTYYLPDRPHAPEASYRWQPSSRNGIGVSPFSGFVLSDSVVSINGYGQVTETATQSVVGLRHSCAIYEGLRSLQTANFPRAACSDVAATTAEHGDLNGWLLPQTELDSTQVYDGLYSFLVRDGYGPTRKIPLKEVYKYKYDYVVSAYGYSTGASPMLMVELRRGDDNLVKVFAGYSPVGGSFVANKWQRYEIEVPYDSIVAEGMFADTARGDYLKVWFGFGEPTGDTSRVMFVDDFVAYPTSTSFTLSSYNALGLPLSSVNGNFERQEFVYDKNHRRRAVRDSRGRIYSDNAKHQMNENVRANHE